MTASSQQGSQSIRVRLLAPLVALIAVFAILAIYASWIYGTQYAALKKQISLQFKVSNDATDLMRTRARIQEDLLLFRITSDPAYAKEITELSLRRKQAVKNLSAYGNKNDIWWVLSSALLKGIEQIENLQTRMIEATAAHDNKRAEEIFKQLATVHTINTARIKDLTERLQTELRDNDWALQSLLNKSYFSLLSVLAFTILLIWSIMVFYRNNILGPLQLLHGGVRAMKLGQLNVQVPSTNAPTEIFEMTSDFNEMAQSLEVSQRDLKLAREQALRAAQIKSDFLANMSHEIRTPLNTIVGMADLIDDNDLSQEKRRYVQILRNSGKVLLNIVGDILDYSKLEAGKFQLEPVTFALSDLGTRIADIMEVTARAKGLNFIYSGVSDPNLRVIGDVNRIEQVLINLLGNAIKFTEKGEIRFSIENQEKEDGKTAIAFVIRDTGIGISKANVEDLFKRFSQADNSITRRFGGTGLGLAIVKQVVHMMGGEVTVESQSGVGSQFRVDLLLASAQSVEPLPLVDAIKNGITTDQPMLRLTERLAGRKILLVDDSADNRFLILTYLKKANCEIATAEDGQQAVDCYKNSAFDIILMDMQMPVLDGFAATRAIRDIERERNNGRTPILALTAFALTTELQKTLEAGCDAHLTKPVRKTELIQTMCDLIN